MIRCNLFTFLTCLAAVAGLCSCTAASRTLQGQSDGAGVTREFGRAESEQDAPELMSFFDETYGGYAFYFVLDRSSAMGERAFNLLKIEVIRALQGMTERSVFCCVFSGRDGPIVYGDPPQKLDVAGKAQFTGHISLVRASPTTLHCESRMREALERAFAIATNSHIEHSVLIIAGGAIGLYPGDDEDPERILREIMAKNPHGIPIHIVYMGSRSGEDWSRGRPLLEKLARATNGTFKVWPH